ncbi:MAG: endonuclease/exonuclease/phosphatase family protein [Thermodesulfobacteriota bacterium]
MVLTGERFGRRGLVTTSVCTVVLFLVGIGSSLHCAEPEKHTLPQVSGPQRELRTVAQQENPRSSLRIGTFNIRNFPCNTNCDCLKEFRFEHCKRPDSLPTDWRRLAHEIRALRPNVLAVNEILHPARLQRFAEESLGASWRLVHSTDGGEHRVGFLYDSSAVELVGQWSFARLFTEIRPREHPEECVRGLRHLRPAFACHFRVPGSKFDFIAVALHLKSGPCASVRQAQWGIMERIVDRLVEKDSDIIILGDFNDKRPRERDFDRFCQTKGFSVATEGISCTVLGRDEGVVFDHILVSREALKLLVPGSVRVGGACRQGCEPNAFWKAYKNLVSDHCPVVAEFRAPPH